MKILISSILVCCMVLLMFPASATEEATPQPTVEEILNEYHQKAFEAQTSGDTGGASAWSRNGSGRNKTLEQETVDQLTEAGYEAYNVTSDNYDNLEFNLKTDFSEIGLDQDGSYIVVISGEENQPSAASSRIIGDPGGSDIVQNPGPSEGSSCFEYTANGTTYYMRYLTVTSSTGTNMVKLSTYDLAISEEDEEWGGRIWDIFSTWLVSVVDGIGEELFNFSYIATIGSLLYDWSIDDNYTELEPNTLTIYAGTVWTAHTIQIWNSFLSRWVTVQSSAYAVSRAKCVGYLYNPVINDLVWQDGVEYTTTRYSPKYSNSAQRWKDAVEGYRDGNVKFDGTGDIHFYLLSETDEIIYASDGQPLFTHKEEWGVPLSS